ncbi:MAG: AAA family ATPase [Lutispora sp.]|uniref:AAA family ATPase n=1 Tax=Lutispora sp. TaxID=2828727 RepID=UPI0035631973
MELLDYYEKLTTMLIDNVNKVFIGKKSVVEKITVAILSGGHVLIEDVPGVGKTTLVQAIAKSLGCGFKRIQFTPDLLPSDITGITVYNSRTGSFEFKEGPIMANVILADEINRSSPKTQSSLLEAMQEGQITVDGVTYDLPKPFVVLATQNPIEYEGTFPLPEAQLDRFAMRIKIGYPDFYEEKSILKLQGKPTEEIESIITDEDVLKIREEVKSIHVEDSVKDYIITIVQATRSHPDIYLGCSPRGSLTLLNACRGLAYIRGRDHVLPDDVKELAEAVLNHRIILKPEAKMKGISVEDIIYSIISSIRVPLVSRNV